MKAPIHILHLEDNPKDAELVQVALESAGVACEITHVETKTDFMKCIEKTGWDLILADYRLPTFDGLSAFDAAHRKAPEVPFILVSGTIGDDVAVDAVRRGVTDFVLKDRLSPRLGQVVRRAVGEAEEQRERKQAETALKVANERMGLVLDHQPIVIYTGILEGSFPATWLTENVKRVTGFAAGDFVRDLNFWFSRVHPEDKSFVEREFRELPKTGQLFCEYRWQIADGSYRWFADRARFVPGNGGPDKITGIWIDISEQKRLQEQFRQAQKMEAIGVLAGGVAHDFNNLLTVILGNTEFALRGLDEKDPSYSLLSEVREAAGRAASLTRQLLIFSRKEIPQAKLLDLNAELESVMKMLCRITGETIDVSFRKGAGLSKIMMDPSLIGQVIMNLSVNARDAMPAGGALVIETADRLLDEAFAREHPGVAPGAYVRLTVSDTGCGMTTEVMGKIFEPFFTTKKQGKGTGLGLATVFGIVQQFKGHTFVESEVNRGTTFTIYFPAVQ